ncbi:MAG: hypothetical protein KTR18_08455 [Acidiferrobacterales bacterium]|nr:hypothetical protein [Acidiferrobacterales bacterium]
MCRILRKVLFSALMLVALSGVVRAGELSERKEIQESVYKLFVNKDFGALNSLGNKYLSSDQRTSSGLWKLSLFYVGLYKMRSLKISDPQYWEHVKQRVEEWIDFDRTASFPHLVMADVLLAEAWGYRGSGYSNEVSKENWRKYYEQVVIARQYLIDSDRFRNTDPRWFELMIDVAKAESWPLDVFYTVFESAVSQYPTFYEIYFRSITYLTPRWHGSVEEIEKFARIATKSSEEYEGQGMYARVYWFASQVEFGTDLFTKSEARWWQMKAGIRDVLEKYPDQWNINNFAHFACMARDKK